MERQERMRIKQWTRKAKMHRVLAEVSTLDPTTYSQLISHHGGSFDGNSSSSSHPQPAEKKKRGRGLLEQDEESQNILGLVQVRASGVGYG